MRRFWRSSPDDDAVGAARTLAQLDERVSRALEAWTAQIRALGSAGTDAATHPAPAIRFASVRSRPLSRAGLEALVAELGEQVAAMREQADAEARQGFEWERRAGLARQGGRADLARQATQREREHLSLASRLALDAMRLRIVHDEAREALARMASEGS